MMLFMLPFLLVGLITAALAVHRAGEGNWHQALLNTLFAAVFGGAGLVGLRVLLVLKRKLVEQEELKAKFPTEPWRWRKDWNSGKIDDCSTQTVWLAWIFAGFWSLVSFPLGLVAVRAAWQRNNPAIYLALLFPAIGVGLLIWALRATLRYKRFGVSHLELAAIPAVIGHSLEGIVRASTTLQPAGGFRAGLSCVRRVVSGTGDNRSVSESILWQDEHPVAGAVVREASGWVTRIPVAFRVPADAQPCRSDNPDDQILWRLSVAANVPGVDYASVFEIPVFRTDASSDAPTQRDVELSQEEDRAVADYRQPADSRIRVITSGRGVEVTFPPARNLAVAAGTMFFMLIWGTVCWGLFHYHAPLIFPIVFGLFQLLLVWITLQLWLGLSRVTATAGTLLVDSGLGWTGKEQSLPAGTIADVTTAIGMQAGGTPYYDVVIRQKDGKKVIAGRAVRDKLEAEWLALTIKRALGLAKTAG
jgi:hypothetical protein